MWRQQRLLLVRLGAKGAACSRGESFEALAPGAIRCLKVAAVTTAVVLDVQTAKSAGLAPREMQTHLLKHFGADPCVWLPLLLLASPKTHTGDDDAALCQRR
jgi:hypothetical protein